MLGTGDGAAQPLDVSRSVAPCQEAGGTIVGMASAAGFRFRFPGLALVTMGVGDDASHWITIPQRTPAAAAFEMALAAVREANAGEVVDGSGAATTNREFGKPKLPETPGVAPYCVNVPSGYQRNWRLGIKGGCPADRRDHGPDRPP
jgi:hypothetical protein